MPIPEGSNRESAQNLSYLTALSLLSQLTPIQLIEDTPELKGYFWVFFFAIKPITDGNQIHSPELKQAKKSIKKLIIPGKTRRVVDKNYIK